jgi:hypothetical protein
MRECFIIGFATVKGGRKERQATIPSKDGNAMLPQESFPLLHERAERKGAQQHKGCALASKLASSPHNAPLRETQCIRRIFSKLPTGEPDCAWKFNGKNLRTIPNVISAHFSVPLQGLYEKATTAPRGAKRKIQQFH